MIPISEAMIREMKELRAKGWSFQDIANRMKKRHGVIMSHVTVSNVVKGRRKANVDEHGDEVTWIHRRKSVPRCPTCEREFRK